MARSLGVTFSFLTTLFTARGTNPLLFPLYFLVSLFYFFLLLPFFQDNKVFRVVKGQAFFNFGVFSPRLDNPSLLINSVTSVVPLLGPRWRITSPTYLSLPVSPVFFPLLKADDLFYNLL